MITRRAKALLGICLCLAVGLAQAAPLAYVVNSDFGGEENANALYRVNLANGNATLIGGTGFEDLEGLALSPAGVLYGVDDATKTLVTIDTDTGVGAPVGGALGNTGLPLGPENSRDFGLTFDPAGTLWLSSDVTGEIWRVNPSTGQLTAVSGSPGATTSGADGTKSAANPGALTAMAACGDQILGIGSTGDHALYRLSDAGVPEEIGPLGAGLVFGDAGLDFDAEGTLWGIADRSTDLNGDPLDEPSIIFTIDSGTGAAERVSETIIGVESLAIAPPAACGGPDEEPQHIPIPVNRPTALIALLLSLLGAGLAAIRRAT